MGPPDPEVPPSPNAKHLSEGEFKDGNCTFFYSGREVEQPKLEGAMIAMKSSLRPAALMWKGIKLSKNCQATFNRPIEKKVLFNDQLTKDYSSWSTLMPELTPTMKPGQMNKG